MAFHNKENDTSCKLAPASFLCRYSVGKLGLAGESLIEKLKTQKRLCPPSDKQKSLRRCVIAPQTSLVYQIKDNIIELVAFFDNRSKHKY